MFDICWQRILLIGNFSSMENFDFNFIDKFFRAIDMERVRHAEMKHQFEMVSKAALVNNIKVRI